MICVLFFRFVILCVSSTFHLPKCIWLLISCVAYASIGRWDFSLRSFCLFFFLLFCSFPFALCKCIEMFETMLIIINIGSGARIHGTMLESLLCVLDAHMPCPIEWQQQIFFELRNSDGVVHSISSSFDRYRSLCKHYTQSYTQPNTYNSVGFARFAYLHSCRTRNKAKWESTIEYNEY